MTWDVPRLVPDHIPVTSMTLALFLASPIDDNDNDETKNGSINTTTTTALNFVK